MIHFLMPAILTLSACTSVARNSTSVHDKDGFQVHSLDFSPPEGVKIRRSVIILPPTGGVTRIEKSYGKKLAKRGAFVKVIQGWSKMSEARMDLEIHQILHARAMKAVALSIQTLPKDLPISLFGNSLGGIYATVAASLFERIDRVFVVAAGNPIPQIIAHSEHKSMIGIREKRFEHFQFKDRDHYAQEIHKVFDLDPSDLPPLFQGKKLGMVLLSNDEAVPTSTQKKLKALWSPDKVIQVNAGHFWGILTSWLRHSSEIVDFLVPE